MIHAEFARRAKEDTLLIGVDRTEARRLYTDVPLSVHMEATGEGPYLEKTVVLTAWIASPLLLIGSIILAFRAMSGWALIAIPLGVAFYVLYYAQSSVGGARLTLLLLVLGCVVVTSALGVLPGQIPRIALLAYLASLFCARIVYSASTVFVRAYTIGYVHFLSFGR